MTFEEQKKRILSGAMYNDLTPELVEARRRAVELTDAYNASYGRPPEVREALLRKLVKHAEPGAFLSRTSTVSSDSISRWGKIFMQISAASFWIRARS